jgi:serine/threonine-protein kinase
MPHLIGQDIDQYHIIDKLGHGSMTNVYKAFDTRLEREVAVKVIRREAVSDEVMGRCCGGSTGKPVR